MAIHVMSVWGGPCSSLLMPVQTLYSRRLHSVLSTQVQRGLHGIEHEITVMQAVSSGHFSSMLINWCRELL